MKTSIVIPAYNAEKTVGKTVEACISQDYKDKFEVIVVNDGSTDNTEAVIKSFPVRYIFQENAGPAAARNRGWKASKGDIVCFTDSDCIPASNWLSTLLEHYKDSTLVGAVCGSYKIANLESLLAQCIHEEIMFRHSNMSNNVRFFGSYNLSIRRSVLEEVGGFDETFLQASGEDNDLSYRIKKAGYNIIFDNKALVAHYHRDSLYRYLKDQYIHGYWRAKLYRDHPDMTSGDDYTRWKDMLEIPLCGLIVVLLPFVWVPYVPAGLLGILLLYLAMQVRFSSQVSKERNKHLFFLFLLVTTIRGFVRTLGFMKGLVRFRPLPYFVRVKR
ncbi:MAG: glycosyltransferase [Candidatus Brocadiales bacterium]|nr:glycosyltransferase [Candidatus Brocadiales bacterium]